MVPHRTDTAEDAKQIAKKKKKKFSFLLCLLSKWLIGQLRKGERKEENGVRPLDREEKGGREEIRGRRKEGGKEKGAGRGEWREDGRRMEGGRRRKEGRRVGEWRQKRGRRVGG